MNGGKTVEHPVSPGLTRLQSISNVFNAYQKLQDDIAKNPQMLDLSVLNQPHYDDYDYRTLVKSLDFEQVKKDVIAVCKDSQDWWPADYGHYGPFMCRLAWHSAGTYRIYDGRGGSNTGNMRFAPLNGWPDNGNLDKARRLLWPVKKKYGKHLSWADLFVLAGNAGMEDMGFKSFGFSYGRVDVSASETDAFWGVPKSFEGLAKEPWLLEKPLGAPNMELIYVNPEGPDGIPDPQMAATHIRDSFGRMSMNDWETVALVAGGHTFGKGHGAGPAKNVGVDPRDANVHDQGFGWNSTYESGVGKDAITSGLEGAWTSQPTKWDGGYFHNLFKYDWELTTTPAGAKVWKPKNNAGIEDVPDAHIPGKRSHPIMYTTDLAFITDPEYKKIAEAYHKDNELFHKEFAKAWYKLLHRDLGPVERCIGPEVAPGQLWQDPVPAGKKLHITEVKAIKEAVRASGLTTSQLVRTAWNSASTFRKTDFRGGANGARVRLSPQNAWPENDPDMCNKVIDTLAQIGQAKGASVADMIVIGGNVGIEMAAEKGGFSNFTVPLQTGRGDASQEQTVAETFDVLRPRKDAFRNMPDANPYMMVDKACLMGLTAPEMTVLIGGLRVLGGNCEAGGNMGVLTDRPGTLSNDFFTNLTDMAFQWHPASANRYVGKDRKTGAEKWSASLCDLTFGSHPELRGIVESYACDDAKEKFAHDFANAWAKVMRADSYGRF